MKNVLRTAMFLLFAPAVLPCFSGAQQKPLSRTFVAGSEERYQVTVIIRVETHGISTEKIGEKTYVTPFTHEAQGQLSWRSTRKISSLHSDESAAIVETLDRFQTSCDKDPNAKNFDAGLQKSVQETCVSWQDLSQMNYTEEKLGLIRGLPVLSSQLTNLDLSLLMLWIRHAFRPSVLLPQTPIQFGARTEHAIANSTSGDASPLGEESTEWFEASSDPPAATLHVSQDLRWTDPPLKSGFTNVGGTPAKRQLFYADSLNTISLLDGSLLKASRSATRETKELLEPVQGLPDAPEFGSKLTVTVTILRLP